MCHSGPMHCFNLYRNPSFDIRSLQSNSEYAYLNGACGVRIPFKLDLDHLLFCILSHFDQRVSCLLSFFGALGGLLLFKFLFVATNVDQGVPKSCIHSHHHLKI